MKRKSYSKTHSTLSRPAELSILFILSQKIECNAYYLKQYMDLIGLNDWLPTSIVTVYKSLKRLLDSGFVEQHTGSRGNGKAEVSCYRITESGRKYLNNSLKEELGTYSREYFRFDLIIGLSSFIETEDKVQLIEQRIQQLRKRQKEVRKELKNYQGGIAFGGWIVLDHQINHLKSEISWLKHLIKLLNEIH